MKGLLKSKGKKAALLLLICLLGVFMGLSSFAAGEAAGKKDADGRDARILTVGVSQLPGMSEISAEGDRSGMVIDFLNEIAKYTNWEYEYVDLSAEELVDSFLRGDIDLMGGALRSAAMEEYAAYPDLSCGTTKGILFCRARDTRMKSYDLKSLNGCTIGVYIQAQEKIRRVKEFLRVNNLDCRLVYYTAADIGEDGTLYVHLENGEVDLLLGNDLEECPQFRVAAEFDAQEHYIVTQAGRTEILDELNRALECIMDSDPNFAEEAYKNNFRQVVREAVQLNQAELDYIENKKTVTVAGLKNWHPFYCEESESEHHNGIVPDLLEKLSETTGLEYQIVYADTYQDAIQMVQEGRADILGGFLGSDALAADYGLAVTKPYVNLNSIVTKNKASNYPGQNLRGGILAGQAMPAGIGLGEVVEFENIYDALKAVNQGECDYFYGLAATTEHTVQNHHFPNIMAVSTVNYSTDISLAVPKPITEELLTILNKGIYSLSEEDRSTILDRNLVFLAPASIKIKDLIYANPIAAVMTFAVILFLIVIIIGIFTWSRVRTILMENELRKAEAENKARGEFLSRMSHEIRTPMNAIVGLVDIAGRQKDAPEPVRENLKKIRQSSAYLLSLINNILDMSRIENGMMDISEEDFSVRAMTEELAGVMEVLAEQKKLSFSCRIQTEQDWLLGDPVRIRQILLNLLSNAFKFTPAGGRVLLEARETGTENGKVSCRFSVWDNGIGIEPENQKKIFEAFEQVGTSTSKSQGTGLGLSISQKLVSLMGGEIKIESSAEHGTEFYFTLSLGKGQKKEKAESEEEDERLKGSKILLAEDNDLNAEIAEALLEMHGISSERAADGQEALTMYKEHAPGYYQAVLMDIQMPVMGGLEAAREIRSSGRPDAKTLPVIAMTANSFKEDVDAAMAAGMDAFIAKPVESRLLIEVLKKCILKEEGEA